MVAPFRFVSVPTLKQVPTFASIGVGVIGLTGLIGWIFNLNALQRMAPGGSVMLPAVILMLLLCGSALWLLANSVPQTQKHRLGQAAAMVVAFISLITIIQYLID